MCQLVVVHGHVVVVVRTAGVLRGVERRDRRLVRLGPPLVEDRQRLLRGQPGLGGRSEDQEAADGGQRESAGHASIIARVEVSGP